MAKNTKNKKDKLEQLIAVPPHFEKELPKKIYVVGKETWHKYRDDLCTQKTEIERQGDKTVFTISTGAIGVSLVIIDKLAPATQYKYFYLILAVSWILLIISIIKQAISFTGTSTKIGNSIKLVDNILESSSDYDQSVREKVYYDTWETKNATISAAGKVAIQLMICGIISLLLFAFLSLYVRK